MLAYKRAQARYKPRLQHYPYPNETHRTSFAQIPKTPTFLVEGHTVDDVVLMDHFRFLIKIGPDNFKSMQLLYAYTVWSDGRSELINVSWFRHDSPYAWLEDAFMAWCSIPRAANNSYLEAAKILRRVMPEVTEEPDDHAPAPKRAKTTTTPAKKKKMYDFGPGGANNPVPLDNDSESNDEPEPSDDSDSSDSGSNDDTVQSDDDSDDDDSDDHEHPPGPFGHKQAWCSGCCEYHAKDAFTPEELQVPADERECRKFGANDQYGNQTRVNRAAKLDEQRKRTHRTHKPMHNKPHKPRHRHHDRKYTHRKHRDNKRDRT